MKLSLAAAVLGALAFSSNGKRGKVLALLHRAGTIRRASDKALPRKLADPPLVMVGETGDPGFPLGLCRGDCDSDADCQSGLHCFKREPRSTGFVPHCSGGEADDPGKDYCTKRSLAGELPWLLKIGDNGVRDDDGNLISLHPLSLCEGDCDVDEDCEPGLYCFQRGRGTNKDASEDVPSCWNVGGDPGEDYCTKKTVCTTPTPTQTPAVGNIILAGSGVKQLLINDGTGYYATSDLPGGSWYTYWNGVAVADMDGNGFLDIIVGNINGPNQLLMNDGQGSFEPQILPGHDQFLNPTRTQAVAVADVNNDGWLDVIVGNLQPNQILLSTGNFTDGATNFTVGLLPADSGYDSRAVAVADFNQDCLLDIIVGNDDQPSKLLINNITSPGTFTVEDLPVPFPRYDVADLKVADFNKDNLPDIIVGNGDMHPNQLLINNASNPGTFIPQDLPGGALSSISVFVSDMNKDGFLDIIIGNSRTIPNQLLIRNDSAPGNFTVRSLLGQSLETRSVAVVDANHDGLNDIVLGNYDCYYNTGCNPANQLLINDGKGGYTVTPLPGTGTMSVAIFDQDI